MVVLRLARLQTMAHGLLVMVEVRAAAEDLPLQRMGMGDLGEEGSWPAEEEVDLGAAEEISEEMGPYLLGNGGEAKGYQIPDTVVMGEAEEGAGVAIDWKLSPAEAMRHTSALNGLALCLDSMDGREGIPKNWYR
jgi:hypothetical protein